MNYLIRLIVDSLVLFTLNSANSINPYLADSPWPCIHSDSYCSGKSDLPTISKNDVKSMKIGVRTLLSPVIRGTLGLYWVDHDSDVAWVSSLDKIYKLDTQNMKVIDYINKPGEVDQYRGIYSFVDKKKNFYTASNLKIFKVVNLDQNNVFSSIAAAGYFELESDRSDEVIVSVNMLFTGEVVFVTSLSRVGIVSSDLTELIDIVSLSIINDETLKYYEAYKNSVKINEFSRTNILSFNNSIMSKSKFDYTTNNDILIPNEKFIISNSICIDEFNGLYVLSSKYLHKLVYDHLNKKIIFKIKGSDLYYTSAYNLGTNSVNSFELTENTTPWTTEYETENYEYKNRLSRYGSGTTPTLFKFENKNYVVICDGLFKQNINVYDAQNGKLIDSKPVTFGGLNNKESYTEQSLPVLNAEFVVVQNAMTTKAIKLNDSIGPLKILEVFEAQVKDDPRLTRFISNARLASVALGDSPKGIEKFRLKRNKKTGKLELESVWFNRELGCPNSIPVVSSHNRLMYCVSKVSRFLDRYPEPFEGIWTLTAINWENGKKEYDIRIGSDLRFNSLFSAVEIGPKGNIFYGSAGGVIKIERY